MDSDIQNLGFLQTPQGYYYKDLTPWWLSWLEILLIAWPKGTRSEPHDHGLSSNVTMLLPFGNKPQLKAMFFSCDHGEVNCQDVQNICLENLLHIVLPYRMHEVINDSGETVYTLHVYFPHR